MRAKNDKNVRPGFHATTVRRPVGLLVIFLTLIVIGLIAYSRIPLQLLPSGLQGNNLTIWVNHPGSSASENEEKVARVLEEQFRTLPDLEYIWSRSGEGNVRLGVKFNGDSSMDLSKAELRDRIERARPLLPDTVDRINVWSFDDGEPPIMFFAILVEDRGEDTDWLVENRVQRALEGVDGVSRAEIWGLLDDSIRILLDEDRVRAANMDIGALIRRLSSDNFTQPLGEVTDGGRRFLLRSDMRFRSFDDVENYPIGDGLRIGDVATVERVKTIRERLTRIDGRSAYYGMVQRESSANVVAVAKRIHTVMDGFEDDPELAGKVGVEVFFDQAKFIKNSLDRLKNTALWGGGLAVLVLFMFLRRVRMTLCVALSIPVSALLAVAWEHFTGGTFNVLTMTGLTLGIGMLVDNSVVVIENIARLRGAGKSPHAAAIGGVRDVGLAIALATMTSVVVFLPLIFMGDDPTMRTMLSALGMPLCMSLLFSLLVALVFLPVITARIMGNRPAIAEKSSSWLAPIARIPVQILALVVAGLRFSMHASLRGAFYVQRGLVAVLSPLRLVAVGALAYGVWWRLGDKPALEGLEARMDGLGIPTAGVDAALSAQTGAVALAVIAAALFLLALPRLRRRPAAPPELPSQYLPRGGSILGWMQNGNRTLLAWTLDHRMLASLLGVVAFCTILIPMGNMTLTAFGQDDDTTEIEIDVDMENNFTFAETSEEMKRYEDFLEPYREKWGFAHVVTRFRPGDGEIELRWDERQDPDDLQELRRTLRRIMPRYAGHELRFSREQQLGSAQRQYVHFQLRGPNAQVLESYGKQAIDVLSRVGGLTDVTSPLENSPEQVRLDFDNESAYRYGVTSDIALQNISWALRGAQLPRYQEAGREIPFIIEYDDEELAGLDTLRDLEVWTGETVVPLSAFAKVRFEPSRRSIFRWNGQTTFNIQARVDDPNRQGELVAAGYAALDGLDMPRGFSLGRDQSVIVRQEEEMRTMKHALLLSIVLVFLLMGILFESLMLPLSVLTTIPFAVLGALWTLFLTGTVMDSVGWIGVIILVGVVVNNGIVLIDKIHRMRREDGVERRRAVLEGASARVRPILMTAVTTVFGLLPMALGEAAREGIDYRALATCVAGGLTISTFFTLWIVPLAYTLIDDASRSLSWLLRRTLHWGPLPERAHAAGSASVAPQDKATI
ncbi:MAG: efflux RND transporter permease subunit [bacterium]|nr:efflux RND transporter permease subunit [bacterium]